MQDANAPATGTAEVSVTGPTFEEFEALAKEGKVPNFSTEEKPAATEEAEKPSEEPEPAPASDPEDKQETKDGEEEGEEEKPAAKKGGFQRRIDRLTRDVQSERREKQELAQRLESIERRLADNSAAQPKEAKPVADGKPTLDKFDTVEEYVDALTDWKAEQGRKAEAERQAQESQREQMQKWEERRDAARGKHDDFDEVMAQKIALSPAMQAVIFKSEHGGDVAYWLGKNPAEAKRIYGLDPIDAARELLKVELTFAPPKPTPEKKPKPSAAPEPITPISGTTSGADHDPYGLKTGDMEKFEKARLREQRGA